MGSYVPISRVCIVGAGPVGVAFAKYLLAEEVFQKIDIFEQRDRVGGVWNLSTAQRTKQIPIPQTNPWYGTDSKRKNGCTIQQSLEFESPLYDYLETNIPKEHMQYSDKPFADDAPLYPSSQTVLKYLNEYADDIRDLIKFECQVQDISLDETSSSEHPIWRVQVKHLPTGQISTSAYDAIVVANGHYTVPSIPEITGIEEWSQTYPGSIIHSKAYRRPEDFVDKKVLVIGNSASGLDIAYQVGQKCRSPVLLSSRSPALFGGLPNASWKEDVDEVVEFLPSQKANRGVRFRSGRIEESIDSVIFCTGYFYSFPFLSQLEPPVTLAGLRVQNTYRHLFHIDYPTLVFPVINLKVIPFPLAENQAAVVARVWSGRLNLPSKAEMHEWEENLTKKKGNGKHFHLMVFPEDAAQINEMYQWSKSATNAPGLVNDGQGKLGTGWDEEKVWLRSKFGVIKGGFMMKGENRTSIKTVEQLGFDYEKWKQNKQHSDIEMLRSAKC